MLLEVKNVGKFYNNSRIEINGITILAGENGTGKSTLGKALYCAYNSLYDYKNQIFEERERSIYRILRILGQRQGLSVTSRKKLREFIGSWRKEHSDGYLKTIIAEVVGVSEEKIDDTSLDSIKKILAASEESILNAMIARRIEGEFDNQVGHIQHQGEASYIKLIIKNKPIVINIDVDGRPSVLDTVNIIKDLVYIDDPYVIDDLSNFIFRNESNHRVDIIEKLRGKKDEDFSAVDDALVDDSLQRIYEMLEKICAGTVSLNDDENYYSDKHFKGGISLKNLSTGMKGFVILKSLLQKGYLEENGMVILDEPEAHLHPEWMLRYAEIVVLLQKVLDINFVVSTHSSEFLSYMELYTRKYGIMDKCNYYLLESSPDDVSASYIRDCTGEIEAIYKKLARPYLWASRKLDEET